ncbi:MAG: hypothetical protein MUF49_08265 [Oculatellaceae cyanobacterium Prado106]|jgi:hypothetical protein|nr:hypothetical protein [Oculatellaceae cyanobacterium Prado106]
MMPKRYLQLFTIILLLSGLMACSQFLGTDRSPSQTPIATSPTTPAATPTATPSAAPTANTNLTQLFSRIWRVTAAPSQSPSGSIYIFLANGTLLQTSCTETYRIATWTIDREAPLVLRVVEDGQLAFTAAIADLSDTTLRLQQTLVQSNEQRDIVLEAVEEEFVCPDLPR